MSCSGASCAAKSDGTCQRASVHIQATSLGCRGACCCWLRIWGALLTALTSLDLRVCASLQQLPDTIGQLTALTSLDLSICSSLQQLPDSIGQLTALNSLDLKADWHYTFGSAGLHRLGALAGGWLGVGCTAVCPLQF
jgi:hypothetical protein